MSLLHSGSHRRQAGGEERGEEKREKRVRKVKRGEEGGEKGWVENLHTQNSSVTNVHRGERKDVIEGDSPS